MFMMSDFGQIGPNNGTSFFTSIVKFCLSRQPLVSGHTRALVVAQTARLFLLFQRHNLNEQVRSGSDEVHCAFIRRFEFSAKESPINKAILDALFFRTLTPQLLQRDPEFEDAIYTLQTNRERDLFNTALLYRFAARRCLPVFKWIRKVRIGTNTLCRDTVMQFYDAGAYEMLAILYRECQF